MVGEVARVGGADAAPRGGELGVEVTFEGLGFRGLG
jgi:hypothetical protein